jgi:hypothetical protein
MKKFAVLALVSAAFAALATAAPCTGGTGGGFVLFTGGTTPVVSNQITCSVTAPANNYITSVSIFTISDLTNGANNPSFTITTQALNFSSTGNGVVTNLTPANTTVTGAAQVASSGALTGNTNQSLTALSVSFLATSAVNSGTANGSSIDASGITGITGTAAGVVSGIFFTYAPITQQGVPEPATLSLVGGALLGLGFIARKRK